MTDRQHPVLPLQIAAMIELIRNVVFLKEEMTKESVSPDFLRELLDALTPVVISDDVSESTEQRIDLKITN